MAERTPYSGYLFVDKDPIIHIIWDIIQKEGLTLHQVYLKSSVKVRTLENWFFGPTQRPSHAGVKSVIQSLGYRYEVSGYESVPQRLGPRLVSTK